MCSSDLFGAGRWSTVPSVAGMPQQSAIDTVRESDLAPTVSDGPVYDDNAPVSTIARTDPPSGSRAVHGSRIVLYLSKGPAPRLIPETVDRPREEARDDLASRGLVVTLRVTYDETVAAGNAIRTEPGSGTTVERGSRVTLFISKGPAPRTIPALAGRSRGAAVAALQRLKLDVVQAPLEFNDTVPAGAVIRTEPVAGTRVSRGSTVVIVLSKGPRLVWVPNVIGKSLDQARRQLERAGFDVKVRSLFGVNDGNVLAQDPLPLSRVKQGSTITLGVV